MVIWPVAGCSVPLWIWCQDLGVCEAAQAVEAGHTPVAQSPHIKCIDDFHVPAELQFGCISVVTKHGDLLGVVAHTHNPSD